MCFTCLKQKLGSHFVLLPVLPPVNAEGTVQVEPEKVLDPKFRREGDWNVTEILVKWKGAVDEDSAWIPYWRLCDKHPHPVGKVF